MIGADLRASQQDGDEANVANAFVGGRLSGGHAWSTSSLEHRGRRAAPVPSAQRMP